MIFQRQIAAKPWMDHSIKPLHKFSFSKPLQLQQGNTLMTPVGDIFLIFAVIR